MQAASTRHDVDTTANGANSIVADDMNEDGEIDLLTSSQDAGTVEWYENDGGEAFTRRTIDPVAPGAMRAEFADVDSDGDLDVVSASQDANQIAWHDNNGNEVFATHVIDDTANGAYDVSPADVDGDEDIDVFAAVRFGFDSTLHGAIAWYENDGNEVFTRHIIDTSPFRPLTITSADIDGDGNVDAVVSSRFDDTVAWYMNDGNGGFTKQVIDVEADGAFGNSAIDMDSDGDIDVLSASHDSNTVAVHMQVKEHVGSIEIGGTLIINTSLLQTTDTDDSPTDLVYTVTAAPTVGEVQLNGVLVPLGGTFTQEDIDNDRVLYVHNGINLTSESFSFTVQDGGEDGVRPASGTFAIMITDR